MAIRYVVQQRKNPKDTAASPKYYLINKSFDSIDREFLIEDMVNNTSLTFHEAATGIDYLFKSIPKFISLGFTVKLGKLGFFTVGIKSEGSETEEEATADKIKSKRLVFVAGKNVRKQINGLPAEKHTKIQ
jgi:predicted histone-like DNA-binding protein